MLSPGITSHTGLSHPPCSEAVNVKSLKILFPASPSSISICGAGGVICLLWASTFRVWVCFFPPSQGAWTYLFLWWRYKCIDTVLNHVQRDRPRRTRPLLLEAEHLSHLLALLPASSGSSFQNYRSVNGTSVLQETQRHVPHSQFRWTISPGIHYSMGSSMSISPYSKYI